MLRASASASGPWQTSKYKAAIGRRATRQGDVMAYGPLIPASRWQVATINPPYGLWWPVPESSPYERYDLATSGNVESQHLVLELVTNLLAYNNGLLQPFLNYNFAGGAYLTSAPIVTVDWQAPSSQRWTVPVGGGIGKIFHLGKLPVNTQLSAYYNVVHPDDGANWQLRFQVQFMFPK